MSRTLVVVGTTILVQLGMAVSASVADIKLLSAGVLQSSMSELLAGFEQSGHKVIVGFASAGAVTNRIRNGEYADVAIAAEGQVSVLHDQGFIIPSSGSKIARVGLGVFVRAGAPKPDIRTLDGLKRALLAAASIAHGNPAGGGPSGIYIAGLLARMDIATDIKSKIKLMPGGAPLFQAVANGVAEIGFGQITEILHAPGVVLVGPLPDEIQNYTVIAAGIVTVTKNADAAAALIALLNSPKAREVMIKKGFE